MTTQTLWTSGGEPVETPVENADSNEQRFPPHAPPFKEDIYFLRSMADALVDAFDLLGARIDLVDASYCEQIETLERRINRILDVIDRPGSAAEAVERLRQLRINLSQPGAKDECFQLMARSPLPGIGPDPQPNQEVADHEQETAPYEVGQIGTNSRNH